MCTTCGCGADNGPIRINGDATAVASNPMAIDVMAGLLADNDKSAAHNREHLNQHGVLAINLMSSPGAGKTALLEATIDALRHDLSIAVIEGDLETENDAARIRDHGVPAIQISTGNGCHLDADMVHKALHRLDLDQLDLLFIENVGNLVCPASFDLGQHLNVTLLSVPEGDDKPAKYPVIFRAADAVLVSKTDLCPVMPEFSIDRVRAHVQALASDAPLITVSCKSAAAMAGWLDWLRHGLAQQQQRLRSGDTLRVRPQPEGARLHGLKAGGGSA
jgi:hydrogenase nickel incorporation protein HypB